MYRYLSIDVLRGVIMIIMALDHVIGAVSFEHDAEVSFVNKTFAGYTSAAQRPDVKLDGYNSDVQRWSRMATHLCAPGFQLLAGMGLAISVARAKKNGVSGEKITSDLLTRGIVLIFADMILMLPVFKLPVFFMVLACIGTCTLCFTVLRLLPKHVIGLVGVGIILAAPYYKGLEFINAGFPGATRSVLQMSPEYYLLNIWTQVGFGAGSLGNMYPVLPWLGLFAIGWWIGLQMLETTIEEGVLRSATRLIASGMVLFMAGLGLRLADWRVAEGIPLSGAGLFDPGFWQFTKYPPSWVFIALTLGVLLFLLGVFRWLLDRSDHTPLWAAFITVYGRTALFYFIVHFYVAGLIALYLEKYHGLTLFHRMSFGQAYLVWLSVLLLMWVLCFGYDKLRQRYRTVLRYF
ncbi:MAG TPA: heparan-alpha-glucosaminide N-acetyltransferase domain-containing protein [Gemmatales bacterium]|nr:heparan-alpha-glucosaminide N-acetyltransferase domain-containing protein [Gemmatales bacterium]